MTIAEMFSALFIVMVMVGLTIQSVQMILFFLAAYVVSWLYRMYDNE